MAQLIPLLPPGWRNRRLLALVGALLGLALLDLAAPDLVRFSWYWLPMVMAVAFATPTQVGGLAVLALVLGLLAEGRQGTVVGMDLAERLLVFACTVAVAVVLAGQRQRGDEHLDQARQMFAQGLENAAFGVCVLAPDGRFLQVNEAAAHLFGRDAATLRGLCWQQILHPEDLAQEQAKLAELKAQRVPSRHSRCRYLRPDGEVVWADLSLSAIRSRAGQIRYFLAQLAEVTDLEESRASLRRSEANYRLIAENALDVVVRTNAAGMIEWISPSVFTLAGWTPAELIGNPMLTVIHPDDQAQFSRPELAGSQGLAATRLEMRLRTSQGQYRWVSLFRRPLLDALGRVTGLVAGWRDVQAEVEARQALLASELSYRMLAENAQDGILILELASGRITAANPYICALLGFAKEELLDKQLWEIGAFADKQLAINAYAELQEKGYIRYEDLPLITKAGVVKEVEFVSNVYRVGDGEVIQCNIRDISDRKAAEKKAAQYQQDTLRSLEEIVASLVMLNERRDPYTAGHEARVADLSFAIGREMGLSDHELQGLRISGMVHDIGKFTIPTEILTKPTQLSAEEMALMRTHVRAGHEVLQSIHFPWPVAETVLHHHERLDGSGYPQQLVGNQISLLGRILAVADTVESMATNRPYRFAKGLEAALAVLAEGKATLYDPAVVEACLRLFREGRYSLAVQGEAGLPPGRLVGDAAAG
jgi:PAS domain S-box-containing protein